MENDFNVRLEAEIFNHKTLAEDITTAEIGVDNRHLAITVDGVEIVFNLNNWIKTVTSLMFGIDLTNYVDLESPGVRAQLKQLIEKRAILKTL